MPDAELVQALKLAKTKPMFFAFIPKLPDGKLMVSRNKIPMKDVLQLKKDMAAGTPVTGTCSGPLDDMIFKVGRGVAGAYENVIPKIVRRDAGLSISITFNFDKQLEEDATEMVKEDAKIPPPLPVPNIGVNPGDEVTYLIKLADILDSFAPMKGNFADGKHFNLTIEGRVYEINQQEAEANRKNARAGFAKAIQQVRQRAIDAQDDYKDYRKTMRTGWFGTAATFVFEHVSVTDPGDRIAKLTDQANAACTKALTSINQNSFGPAATSIIEADTSASTSHHMMLAYKAGLEHSAGTTVTVLEGVKTASEITLAVGGAVVTGGGTVAFVGGMGITAASDLAPGLVGQKVDWGKFAFDMALGVVLKKVAPGEAMEKAILDRLGVDAVKKVGLDKAKEAVAKIIAGEGEALAKKGVETAQKKLSGKEVTWDEFGEEAKKEVAKEGAIDVLKLILKK